MKEFLKKLFGLKKYLIEIKWDDSEEKEIVSLKARSEINAIEKVIKRYDVTNNAVMTVLDK